MEWLEVVELRAMLKNKGIISQTINCILVQNQKENYAKIYVQDHTDSEWSIHIQNQSDKINQDGSELGSQLAEILKKFGLVKHFVLKEVNLLSF